MAGTDGDSYYPEFDNLSDEESTMLDLKINAIACLIDFGPLFDELYEAGWHVSSLGC